MPNFRKLVIHLLVSCILGQLCLCGPVTQDGGIGGLPYRIAVIFTSFAEKDSEVRITNETATSIFNEAVSFENRVKTMINFNNPAVRLTNSNASTGNNTGRSTFTKLQPTILSLDTAENMYTKIVDKSEVAKGQLIAVLDLAECTAVKCKELNELFDVLGSIVYFTSCCFSSSYLGPTAQQNYLGESFGGANADNDDDDENADDWALLFDRPPDMIYDGVQPRVVFSFANQMSRFFKWRRFHFFISPNVPMFDRFIDELFMFSKSKRSGLIFTKGFFCSTALAQAGACSVNQSTLAALNKGTAVFFLLDKRVDLLKVLTAISNISGDPQFSRGKALVLIDIDGITALHLGEILRYAPNGLMIMKRKQPLLPSSRSVNSFGMPNSDSGSLMYNEIRMLSKAIDVYLKNPDDFSRLSALYCGSKFTFIDSANTTVMFSGHCDIDEYAIEVWNVKALQQDGRSVSFVEKVYEMDVHTGFHEINPAVWIGSGLDEPTERDCDFNGHSDCPLSLVTILPGSVTGFAVLFALCVIVGILIRRVTQKRKMVKTIAKQSVIANFADLEFIRQQKVGEQDDGYSNAGNSINSASVVREAKRSTPQRSGTANAELAASSQSLLKRGKTVVAKRSGEMIYVSLLSKSFCMVDDQLVQELLRLKDLHHPNINPFLGITPDAFHICALHEYCAKGTLAEVLARKTLQLNRLFKVSFASDIAAGIAYLHQSSVHSHGDLTSHNIFVDARWFCKISHIPLPTLRDDDIIGTSPSFPSQNRFSDSNIANKETPDLLDPLVAPDIMPPQGTIWTAPELLRMPVVTRPCRGSQKADVYSYGIVLFEILTRTLPFAYYDLPEKVILTRIRAGSYPPFRPQCRPDKMPDDVLDLIELARICWEEVPVFRPNFQVIQKFLQKMNNGKETQLVDEMIAMMESYAENLEATVSARTRELVDEQQRSEELLSKMLPRSIIVELKAGHIVHPEQFDLVTVYFSDIVGFTKLSAQSSALELVNLLNDLYSEFDHVIDSFNVYKVETIGDAYMVAGGLPIRNKDHAAEIATMSLEIMSRVTLFRIRHRPEKQLQLRIGIHSGSVVAGIVGLKMPRYCLFGDTVNYASRMESSGLALRIHVSPESKTLLDEMKCFHFESRGSVTMKGKGTIETYHLIGKDGFNKPMPDLRLAASIEEHEFK